MTTPNTDPLVEQIARALYWHDYPTHMGGWDHARTLEKDRYAARAAAVLPIVHAAVRAGHAEALRDAKGRVYASSWWADGRDNYADKVRGFLSTCADEIEKEPTR